MKTLLLTSLLLFVSIFNTGFAENRPDTHVFPVELVRVLDGDTMDVVIDMGLGIRLHERLRVLDFDAAETWRPRTQAEREHGEAATERTKELLSKPFYIRANQRGNFGRVLGDIILNDGTNFATVMKDEGFAKLPFYPADKE